MESGGVIGSFPARNCRSVMPVLAVILSACSDPLAPPVVPAVIDASAGVNHTCAVMDDGVAYCWGLNDKGQLGVGDYSPRMEPTRVSGDLRFAAIAAGDKHTCALTTDGVAWCWGWNAYYQRGNAFEGPDFAPVRVTGDRRYSAIDAGWHHTCAIAEDGEVFCWGNNRYGQLGEGSYNTSVEPVPVRSSLRAVDISAGAYHSCAVTTSGGGECWGANEHGQLGVGSDAITIPVPSAVRGGPSFRQISAGVTHTCAVGVDARAYCWGSDTFGELGDLATFEAGLPGATTPLQVKLALQVTQISAGRNVTCAALPGGPSYCWGRGLEGQLGNAEMRSYSAPQPLHLMPGHQHSSDTLQFSAFSLSTALYGCGIADGGLYCWGTAPNGELGDAQSRFAPMPQRVRLH